MEFREKREFWDFFLRVGGGTAGNLIPSGSGGERDGVSQIFGILVGKFTASLSYTKAFFVDLRKLG